jgi:LuxR family transcriptional regulator, maltose regulon positive regulatory protein
LAWPLQTLARLGETERAEQVAAGLGDQARDSGEILIALAELRLAQGDPHAATAALAPVLGGSSRLVWPPMLAQAFLLQAIADEALGEHDAASAALERALDQAEPDGVLTLFLLHPAPELLERHANYGTAHPSLLAGVRALLTGQVPTASLPGPEPLPELLRASEIRVLRFLPTSLSVPEIARELSVSTNTVKTHLRNLYAKLGAHRRAEAVDRARALGLLAPSAGRR